MKIVTEEKEYIHIRKLRDKILLEIGDTNIGNTNNCNRAYYVTLTKQEVKKVIEMLQESIE